MEKSVISRFDLSAEDEAPVAPEEEPDKEEGKREHDEIAPTPEAAQVMAIDVRLKPLRA